MSKLLIVSLMALAAMVADAQSQSRRATGRRGAVGADGGMAVAKGKDARVAITRKAQLGAVCLQSAPSANGNTNLKVSRKPRQWIVPELEYQTAADWQDELTFTWHVLLDSKSAKQRDKPSKDKEPVSRYSYYTTSVRYMNIPKGAHGASVVLPPSILERFGEPVVISVRIFNKEGDVLDGQDEGASNLKMPENWWENDGVFSVTDKKTGALLITRRQGLLDRSKTIFALVNPDDYEMVHQ